MYLDGRSLKLPTLNKFTAPECTLEAISGQRNWRIQEGVSRITKCDFLWESRIAQEQDSQDGLTNAGLIKIPLNNFPCTNLIIFEKNQYPCYQKSKHNTNELLAQIAKGTQVPLRHRLGVTFFVAHLAVTLILWCAPNKVSAT